MTAQRNNDIPILTEIVDESPEVGSSVPDTGHEEFDLPGSTIPDLETVIAELQTRIAARTYELTDSLMRSAFAELEATMFRQLSSRLRQQLPEVIDSVIRDHFARRQGQDDDE